MKGTLKVRRIRLSCELLERMPVPERPFFLLAGHIQNEVNSLNKVFAWCLHAERNSGPSKLEALADGVQAQIYARLLAGKIFEAWQALDRSFFKTKISKRIEGRLDPVAQSALKALKASFKDPKLLKQVRNSFAFHYHWENFDANWRSVVGGPTFEVLLGGTVGNNLNVASEFVVNAAILDSAGGSNREDSLLAFFDEVYEVAQNLSVFLEGVILYLLQEAAGDSLENLGCDEEISPPRSFGNVAIPYFYNHGLSE